MCDATKPLQALCIQEPDLNTSSKTCFELGCVLGFAHWAMVIPQSSWIHESLPRLKSFCWLALLKKVRQTVGPHLLIILTRVYKYTCMSDLYIYMYICTLISMCVCFGIMSPHECACPYLQLYKKLHGSFGVMWIHCHGRLMGQTRGLETTAT